jgi:hypothetical protein
VDARAYTVPTDRPEGDGTLDSSSTTIVIAEARALAPRRCVMTRGAPKAFAAAVDVELKRGHIEQYRVV